MKSLNLEYVFDKTFDIVLFFRYVYYFKIKDYTEEEYLNIVSSDNYDGLRDRGWLKINSLDSSGEQNDNSFKDSLLSSVGVKNYKVTDKYLDAQYKVLPDFVNPLKIGNVSLTHKDVEKYFYQDLSLGDKVLYNLGFVPMDTDSDGLPNSFEIKNNLSAFSPDTDMDGIPDGVEIFMGSSPYDFRSFPKSLSQYVRSEESIDYINKNQIVLYKPFSDVSLTIRNPILGTIVEMYVVFAIFLVPILIFLILRWWWLMMGMFDHYYHTFHNAIGWDDKYDQNPIYEKIKKILGIKSLEKKHNHDHVGKSVANKDSDNKIENIPKKVLTDKEYEMLRKWNEVEKYMSEPGEVFWRIAIIEADNILDSLLKDRGYLGKDVGSRLKSATFESIQYAWEAHKVRNNIAHNDNSNRLSLRDARVAIENYRKVFEDFGIL